MMPLPSLSVSSSSSATSGVKGDTSQSGAEAGGSATNRGFQNNFAGIGSRLAAGDSSIGQYLAIGAVVVVVGLIVWLKFFRK